MAESPNKLPYGLPDTQCGVVTEQFDDGGVRLTIPASAGKLNWLSKLFSDEFLSLFRKPWQPRAVVILNTLGLSITEYQSDHLPVLREFPLNSIGELRLNRYGPGIYISVPGKSNFDLLPDVNRHVVEYVADCLGKTLEKLRKTKSPLSGDETSHVGSC